MKRGISFALQAAGMGLACLATTLSCSPVLVPVKGHSIKCYYNEEGELIYRDTLADSGGTYVIRTCQTKEQMYADYYRRYKDKKKEDSTIARIIPVTKEIAMQVEQLIKNGKTKDSLVEHNIISIEAPAVLLKIWKWIPDTGNGIDPLKDFREYGGRVKRNRKITHKQADTMEACEGNAYIDIEVKQKDISFFHSHPSGEAKNGVCGFTQAPSRGDQISSDKRISYVFGMKSHRVYIMNRDGVHASLPFRFFLPCD